MGFCVLDVSVYSVQLEQKCGPNSLCPQSIQYQCLGLCTIQSIVLHTVHLICGSSSVRHIGLFKGILSSMPVELTGGVEDIDTASVEIGTVGAVVEVIVPVVVWESQCLVGK